MAYQSTINPNVPVQGSSLSSAVVRNNFAAAAGDINALASLIADTPIGFNYLNYPGAVTNGLSDATTSMQNFLLWCQLQALALATNTHDDLLQRLFVTAYFPRTKYVLTCPLIVPEFVNLKSDGEFVRSHSPGGNPTAMNYTGDTTSNANYNLFFPTVITVPRSHIEAINILCNPDGTSGGSGLFCNKSWTMASIAISNPGSGYGVGNVLTFAQPSKNYYFAAQATVTSVDGSGRITGATLTGAGAYALPPFQQQQQWTAANGFTGSVAAGVPGQVFDVNGAFVTAGGTGTGATFLASWTPDWTTGNTLYNGGAFLVTDTLLGAIRVQSAGNSFSTTFGPMYGFWPTSGNYEIDHVQTGGGNIGIYIRGASDIRANSLNAVDAETNMQVFAMGSFECPDVVLDTCTGNTFFTIDQTDGAILKIHCLMPPNLAGTLGEGYIGKIGASSSGSSVNANVDVEINCTNCGTTAGVPMLYLANTKGSKVKAYVSNYGLGGVTNLNVINAVATFGTGWDVSNIIEGTADQIAGNLFNGTVPLCGINVWDTSASGYAGPGNRYTITLAGAPTNGATGANKAMPCSTVGDLASGAIYRNTGTQASPVWTTP